MMKKKTAWIMSVLLILGLSGCGDTAGTGPDASGATGNESQTASAGNENQSEAGTSENQSSADTAGNQGAEEKDYKDTEFRIAWWGGDERNEKTIQIIENFEKQYQNLSIEVEYGAYGDYFTKLTTQATGGELPDLFMMNYSEIVTYVEGGQLEPFDQWIADGYIDLSEVDDSLLSGGIVNGKMYGISTGVNAPASFYDPAVLEELGLSMSVTPSYGEVFELGQKVYDQTGKKIYLEMAWESFGVYLRSMGKELYNEEGTAYGFDADDLVDFMSYGYEYEFVQNPVDYGGETDAQLSDANDCWMVINGYWTNNLGNFESAGGKELALCGFPCADNAETSGAFLKPSMLWSVSPFSENKELAMAFIDYFTNDPYVYDVCDIDRGVPVSAPIRESITGKLSSSETTILSFIDTMSDGVATDISPQAPATAGEAGTSINELFEKARYDKVTKEELEQAIEKGNAVLQGK